MSAYLGRFGQLIPIYSTPEMTVSGIPERRLESTAEGRVKAHVLARGSRQWELSAAGGTAHEVSTLRGFASGEWGHGPFVWVSPEAPSTNLMLPEDASCDPSVVGGITVAGGPMVLPDGGIAGRSLMSTDPAGIYYFPNRVPVLAGAVVTASIYVAGAGGRLRLAWYDTAGALISTSTSVVLASGVDPVRSYTSMVPPAGAVSCAVGFMNASQVARPAFTWASGLAPWADGRGCAKAIVSDMGSTVRRTGNGGIEDASFTITEVG